MNAVTVACVYESDDAALAALRHLFVIGVAPQSVRVGATNGKRADALATEVGARSDVDPIDPLHGVVGVRRAAAYGGVDYGAFLGGIVGAVIGVALGLTRAGSIIAVSAALRPLADGLLFFAIGAIAGAVLGNALGAPPSTHAGFRLIDAMEEGRIAVIVEIPEDKAESVRRSMEAAGASELLQLPRESREGKAVKAG